MLGAVLTGGASRRMGIDKALVEVDGAAMALRVARALRAGGAGAVVCVGGDRAALRGLGLDVVGDRYPGEGPLGGVCTAIVAARERGRPILIVAACDQYRLDAATVVALLGAVATAVPESTAVAVAGGVPGTADRRPPPLPMAFRIAPVAPVAEAVFAAGDRSLRALLGRTGAREVGGLDPRALTDADTSIDLPPGSRVMGRPITRPVTREP